MNCVACGKTGAGCPNDCGLCIECGIAVDGWVWPEPECRECEAPVENGDDDFCSGCVAAGVPSLYPAYD